MAGRKRHYSKPAVAPANPFGWFCLSASGSFLKCIHCTVLCWILEGNPWQISRVLFRCSSYVWYSVLWPWSLRLSTLFNPFGPPFSTRLPSSCSVARKLLRAILGLSVFVSFLSKNHLMACCKVSWELFFKIFKLFFVHLFQVGGKIQSLLFYLGQRSQLFSFLILISILKCLRRN